MNSNRFSFVAILLALGLVFGMVWSTPANADNLYASIRGTVVDPSGAVVAGAKLTATNIATGLTYKDTSDKDGTFAFLQLPIGDYSVKIEKSGFKSFNEGHIHLDIAQIFALKAAMELGSVSDTVTVEANAAQVESTDMQLSATITGSQIVDIPLNGRNWAQLMQLQPGVQASSDRFGVGAYSTNGSETQQNAFLINGVDSNDSSLNVPLVVPSPDAIGEVTMVTSTINPEYGRNSGAIINAGIKNGTNKFHGDAFEFYRDTFLDAKSWFEKQASPFHQNEYGGTIGGPIIKDHAFFFFSYQGLHERIPQAFSVPKVYSAAERTGDFSATDAGAFSTNPIPVAMFGDSASPCPVSGGIQCQPGALTSTYANLFSTGVIPTQDLSPLSLKLMNQFVPLPNSAGNQFQFNPITTETSNQYIFRVDEKLTQKDNIWFYGLNQSTPSVDTLPFTGSTLPGMAENAKRHYQEYTTSWTHTFSPTTLNEARVAYLRFNFVAVNPVDPINPQTYGFTGINPQNSSFASLPVMGVAGLFTLGFSSNGPQPRIQNTYQFVDNLSKVWRHHTFKAGFSTEILQINNPFFSNLSGNFSFNGGGVFSTSDPGADFLLGIPDNYSQGSGSIIRGRGHEYYSYFQDQWQVKSNLTLTLGLGWDIETPWRNLYANGEIMAAWRPNQQSTVFPTAPPGFVYPGDAGINKYGGVNVPYKDFAPRVGFAWSPGGSHDWSVRGGIGLYYNRSEEELALQTLLQPPFALGTNGASSISAPAFATPFTTVNAVPIGTLGSGSKANPFPFVPPAPGATNIDFSTYAPIGLDFNVSDPRLTTPRSTNFNLNIQRQISKSTVVTLGYVGSIGRHEEGAFDANLAGNPDGTNPLAAASGCPFGLAMASCPLQTPITENPNLTWTNGAPVPGATPYNLGVYGHPGIQATAYNSNYNALQAEFNRHFSNGMQVQAAYTWSRYFDQTSNLEGSAFNFPGINPFNPASMYGPSQSDAPQRFVVNYRYTLPFYKLSGHRWRRLTDDWNVVGIYTLQHGFPVPVFDLLGHSLTCDLENSFYACPDRPDRSSTPLTFANPRTFQGTINGGNSGPGNFWFTNGAAVFPIGAAGSGIGSANRNPLYGPGINYGDMAIEKQIHIDESKYVELRFETFNTFNHANFTNPATPGFTNEDASAASSSTFGQIFGVRSLTTNGDGRVVQLGAKIYF
ncbi:MAG TPA: carboxypeptidase regulatory-like domain-containing protein [Candidatus Acidoferrales bacterium]|nr:carboxypeptidase regulatory-like domain-containing protein [Candidatus Acidoferrales bacterium]